MYHGRTIALAALIMMFLAASSHAANVFNLPTGRTSLEFVTVGDPGNSADDRYSGSFGPYGAVPYSYRISKYEVTNAQYIEFLNHVATTDTYGLYNPKMGSDAPGGISRSGIPGSYLYGPRNGNNNWLNRPVVYVSFWNACRFANWLENGQPSGLQNASTTEDGAYALSGYTGNDGTQIVRRGDARCFVPSENEWYKAAYYKGGGQNAGYWTYPMQSDQAPTASSPPGLASPPGSACFPSTHQPIGSPYWMAEVGAYKRSPGPYGTFDQGGNASEWSERIHYWRSTIYRAALGGDWQNGPAVMLSPGGFGAGQPGTGYGNIGFRVVSVPEPGSLTILLVGAMTLLAYARRRGALAA
ncbi:MAG: formylglycine-generating enzyme family protein [Pirellulales bacterium]